MCHLTSWHDVALLQPDEPSAVMHYYFGALAGDPFSRLALGYRHLHGIDVPKNCWTAATYYQPVAELVSAGPMRSCPGQEGRGIHHLHAC